MNIRKWNALVVVLVVMLSAPQVWAATKLGGEIKIDTIAGTTSKPAVALLSTGQFVVVWGWSSGSNRRIYFRRVTAAGAPVGAMETRADNAAAPGLYPQVTALSGGGFVITWATYTSAAQWDIYGRVFSNTGATVSDVFRVNQNRIYDQIEQSVAGLSNGTFVVTFTSQSEQGIDEDCSVVMARRFNASGAPLSNVFKINNTTTGCQHTSSVSRQGTGFVVAWNQSSAPTNGIFYRRYTAAGAGIGATETQANVTTLVKTPRVALLNSGGFVVAWAHSTGGGDDVYARRFGPAGGPAGGELVVRAEPDHQNEPAVAVLTNGHFVVVWTSRFEDGSLNGVYGREYTATGAAFNAPFIVNTATMNDQESPAIAPLSLDRFVVVYQSDYQSGMTIAPGIYFQRFGP